MKISYNWMQEYGALHKVGNNGAPTVDEFAKKFDAAGYDVEKVTFVPKEESGMLRDDYIIDYHLTRNRRDMTCMMWTAKELCGVYQIPYHDFALYGLFIPKTGWVDQVSEDTDYHLYSTTSKCRMLCGRIINHVKTGKVSEWVRDCLISQGLESIHSLADIPLFCGRNSGEPMWLLDLNKLSSKEICVEEAKDSGTITYQGKAYAYNPGDVVVSCDGKVIGISIVIFDDSVIANETTTAVASFSGVFDVDDVRATIDRLGIETWQGYLAAIGAAAPDVLKVINNSSGYIYEFAEGDGYEAVEIYNKYDMTRKFTTYTLDEINTMLSTDFTYEEVKEALNNPELMTTKIDEKRISTMFPSYRTDNKVCDIAQSLLVYLGCGRIGRKA